MKIDFAFVGLGLLSLILCTGCKKNTPFMNSGTIIGTDARMGVCNGGTYIKIDGHPNPNDTINGYYDIGTLPPSFQIDNATKFPVRVKLDWKIDPKCFGNYVDISRIEITF